MDPFTTFIATYAVTLGPWAVLILAIHGLAVAVVNLTPTPKDNEILAKFYRGVEFLAGIFTAFAKK